MLVPTLGRIILKVKKTVYESIWSPENLGEFNSVYEGFVYSLSDEPFADHPISTEGTGNFSWVRKPNPTQLTIGSKVLFMPHMATPAIIGGEHYVLVEDSSIFAVIHEDEDNLFSGITGANENG